MNIKASPNQGSRIGRWASIAGALGLIALLSGCIVYPVGGGYGHGGGGYYGHDRYWR